MRILLFGALCFPIAVPAFDSIEPENASAPAVEEIVGRMTAADRTTTPQLHEYTSVRRYVLENKRFGKRASMTVRMTFRSPGHKDFQVLEEHGSAAIRSRVFRRMLAAETEAAGNTATQVSPQNYSFRLAGMEDLDGRRSYVLEATPRTKNAYLFRGRVWVDAADFAIAKIEGSPAQSPSFWVRRTVFVHRYAKFGPFWLAVSNQSETDVVLFGKTDVKIEYSDYHINERPAATD